MSAFVVFLLLSIPNSQSFRECEQDQKQKHPYNQLHKKHSPFFGMQIRGRLDLACTGIWFVENKDPINVVATIFVAIFTLTLWQSTNRLARSADDQRIDNQRLIQISTDAANAANISAKAALGVELPRLELSGVYRTTPELSLESEILRGGVTIDFKNHGRTAAHLVESGVSIVAKELPEKYAIPQRQVERFDIGDIVESGSIYSLDLTGRFSVDGKDKEAVFTRFEYLYIYGFVSYRDFLDGFWITKFCIVFEMGPHGRGTLSEETTTKEYRGRQRYDPAKPGHVSKDRGGLLR